MNLRDVVVQVTQEMGMAIKHLDAVPEAAAILASEMINIWLIRLTQAVEGNSNEPT